MTRARGAAARRGARAARGAARARPRCSARTLLVEEGDDLVDTAARVAAERGTTYVLIGQPRPHTGLRRFTESLPDRLLRKLPGVDVRIVADRSRRLDASAAERDRSDRSRWSGREAGRARRRDAAAGSGRRILFPFIGSTVSRATLDATLRLARSQDATLVPAYLVIVPAAPVAGVSRAGARMRGGAAGARADRAARESARACRSTRASSAAAPTATRCRRCSSTSATTRWWCRRGRAPATASTPADVAWLLENAPGRGAGAAARRSRLRAPRPSGAAT